MAHGKSVLVQPKPCLKPIHLSIARDLHFHLLKHMLYFPLLVLKGIGGSIRFSQGIFANGRGSDAQNPFRTT